MKYVFVPGLPVPKGRPRVINGHTYTPKRTRRAERSIQWYALAAKIKPMDGPINLDLTFYLSTHKNGNDRRIDLDNLIKLVLDALNGTAWHDDVQIVAITARKVLALDGPEGTAISIMQEAT